METVVEFKNTVKKTIRRVRVPATCWSVWN